MILARTLGLTNKDRQQMTVDMALHAKELVRERLSKKKLKLLFVAEESYNPGVIGLVAGKLVEEFYRPSIVLSKGELISKASARSISGFNIVEAIRACADLLIDVGGHPMAAGFTVETKNLQALGSRLEELADSQITDDMLVRKLRIDAVIPLSLANERLWVALRDFEPFGLGNFEPVFATKGVMVVETRLVGNTNKHLKLRLRLPDESILIEAIGFGLGELYGKLRIDTPIDIAYTIDMNLWNGNKKLQLKVKDIQIPQ
jgi:single-stranded-DNA-specific exonuclease